MTALKQLESKTLCHWTGQSQDEYENVYKRVLNLIAKALNSYKYNNEPKHFSFSQYPLSTMLRMWQFFTQNSVSRT